MRCHEPAPGALLLSSTACSAKLLDYSRMRRRSPIMAARKKPTPSGPAPPMPKSRQLAC
jgi:hypothetical protein